jgi:hypothetical protein
MIRRLLYGILLAQPVLAGNCFATSIVAIRSPDSVAIAADSMLTIRHGADKDTTRSECKIFHSGNIFFSFAGFYKDPGRGFDIVAIVSDALGQGVSFGVAADKAAVVVVDAMKDEVRRIRTEAPALYVKYFEAKTGPLLQILFAAYEDGVPRVAVYDIKKTAGPTADIALGYDRNTCPGNCNVKDTVAYFLTDMRPIEEYMKREKLKSMPPEKTPRFLVDLVINARTPDTGPPVDVLRIDGKGAAWVEHKAECPDISMQDQ